MIKPAKGKRQCRCKNKMVTRQLGPGMYQQYTTQECEECDNVKVERERETLKVRVEPGMKDGQVRRCGSRLEQSSFSGCSALLVADAGTCRPG